MANDHLVMISGKSASGKSASLMGLAFDSDMNPRPEKFQQGVLYLCTEAGKKLPFPNKFLSLNITDPIEHIEEAFDYAKENEDDIHTIVIDSQTFLMDQYESQYVLGTANTMQAWGEFAQFFKVLMQQRVAEASQKVIFTAHTLDLLNESEGVIETKIPVKGSLKNQGIEAYFSCVISTKKVPLKKLAKYENKLLTITPEEEAVGFKYVFQTLLTKETCNERIRSPRFMWTVEETFIDNNIQLVLDRLDEFYE